MSDFEASDEELSKPILGITSDNEEESEECDLFSALPQKSKERYINAYNTFMEWKSAKNVVDFPEDLFMEYFTELSKVKKPSTLWALYSMIRGTISTKDKVDISSYKKLTGFLKTLSSGYTKKKTKTLTRDQIAQFIKEAPDLVYLATKVILILGISGACKREELHNLSVHDFEDRDSVMLVKVPGRKDSRCRSFAVTGEFYSICKKYTMLRPPILDHDKFLIGYQKGKCTKQPMGINKLGGTLKEIALFLNLPDPDEYTGHGFRRSSGTVLVNSEADLSTAVEETHASKYRKVSHKFSNNSTSCEMVLPTSNENGTNMNYQNRSKSSSKYTMNSVEGSNNNQAPETNIENTKNITLEILGPNATINLNFTNCPNMTLTIIEKKS